MENNPIEILLKEHEYVAKAESIVAHLNGTWNLNEHRYIMVVEELLVFFSEYADAYHHRKEEDILFPEILNNPDFVLPELVHEFEEHHEEFRNSIQEIKDAISDKEFKESYDILKNYVEELLSHIEAENDELFVMAENFIDEDQLEKIYFRFMDIDIGLGLDRKNELETMIEKIEDSL